MNRLFAISVVLLTAFPVWASSSEACATAKGNCSSGDDVTINGIRGIRVTFEVESSVEELWTFASDCLEWGKHFWFVQKCNRLKGNPERGWSEFGLSVGLDGRYVVAEAIYLRERKRIEFRRVKGDFRQMYGRWSLKPVEHGRVEVTWVMCVDASWYIPNWIVRRRLRGTLPGVVSGLQRWLEARSVSVAN